MDKVQNTPHPTTESWESEYLKSGTYLIKITANNKLITNEKVLIAH
jgi:hypothetical protein